MMSTVSTNRRKTALGFSEELKSLPGSFPFRLLVFVLGAGLALLARPLASSSPLGFIAWIFLLAALNEAGLRLLFLVHLNSRPTARSDAFFAFFSACCLPSALLFLFRLSIPLLEQAVQGAGYLGSSLAIISFMALMLLVCFRIIFTGMVVTRLHVWGPWFFGTAARLWAKDLMPLSGRLPVLRWWDESGHGIRAVYGQGGNRRSKDVRLCFFLAARCTEFDKKMAAYFALRARRALLARLFDRKGPDGTDAEETKSFLSALGNALLASCFLEEERAGREADRRAKESAGGEPPGPGRRLRPVEDRPMSSCDLNAFFVYCYLDAWMEMARREAMAQINEDEDFILAHLGFSPYRDLSEIITNYDPNNKNVFNNESLCWMAVNYKRIASLDADPEGAGKIPTESGSLLAETGGLQNAQESGIEERRVLCLPYEAQFLSSAILLRAWSFDGRLFLKMTEEWDAAVELSEDALWMAAHCSMALLEPPEHEEDSPYRKRLTQKALFWEKRAVFAALENGISPGFVPGFIRWETLTEDANRLSKGGTVKAGFKKSDPAESWPEPSGFPSVGLMDVLPGVREKREGLPQALVKPAAIFSFALTLLLASAFTVFRLF